LRQLLSSLDTWPETQALAANFTCRAGEKYERLLSESLTTRVFARERLDIDGARRVIVDSLSLTQ
jgi:hypothetical protein